MDLRGHILSLFEPAGLGEEILPGARLVGVSTELGPILRFDLGGLEVRVHVEPIDPNRPSAARSGRLMFSYGSDGGQVEPATGLALCRRLSEIVRPREKEVFARIAEDAAHDRAGGAQHRIREVHADSLLEPLGGPERRFYSISPYVGCLIGCRFCYAQAHIGTTRRLEHLQEVPWGSYVDVRVNAPGILAQELARTTPAPLKFCPIVSDPYQATEKRYALTRRCLEVIRDAPGRWPVLVLTRSTLIERDVDLLASLSQCYVGVSIPTVDDEVRRHFEPRAAKVEDRLRLLELFRRRGVSTFAVVQPQLPGDVEALASALAERVGSASIDVLHGEEGASDDFDDPRYQGARSGEWQERRAATLARLLSERGVVVWSGELPPLLS